MIIKLIPGQRIALKVLATTVVEGNYGPQIKFTGSTPDDADAAIFLNVDTAEQQLGRIGLDVASVLGQTVEIERVEKNGRKFTNINRIGAGQPYANHAVQPHPVHVAGKPAPTKEKQGYSSGGPFPWEDGGSAPDPTMPFEKLDKLFNVYDLCLDHAISVGAKKLDASDVGSSPEAITAMAATLFIAAKDRGLAA